MKSDIADANDSASNESGRYHDRFVCRLVLPLGAERLRLRAIAYDVTGLGSTPVDLALHRPGIRPVRGRLLALCIGVSHYSNGRTTPGTKDQFVNLRFPTADALAMARRLREEGMPLYQEVRVHSLTDSQATLAGIRRELQWLRRNVRPGQVDTVILFLSGHGVSDSAGGYHYPTYEFDPAHFKATSLSGRELQDVLGTGMPARSVFLFADTCHSGALAEARADDLGFEVNPAGICMIASSQPAQFSYESPRWGHGALTLALLRSLARKDLARAGVIPFSRLSAAVPREMAALMQGAGSALEVPAIPVDVRDLEDEVAQPHSFPPSPVLGRGAGGEG